MIIYGNYSRRMPPRHPYCELIFFLKNITRKISHISQVSLYRSSDSDLWGLLINNFRLSLKHSIQCCKSKLLHRKNILHHTTIFSQSAGPKL